MMTTNNEFDIKNITFIGAGFVGATNSIVMAHKCPDISICAVDQCFELIDAWNSNKCPIYEPCLEKIFKSVNGNNFHFSSNIIENIKIADIIFICVNTPTKSYGVGKGRALNTSYLEKAATMIRDHTVKNNVIVVEKSTVPVKSAEKISAILKEKRTHTNFYVISNPEFLAEGNAVENFLTPDRVLIGGGKSVMDRSAVQAIKKLYLKWVPESKILLTDTWSSELSKLTSNAFLAQRISSINSISAICEKTGANIHQVSKSVGLDSRIGSHFLCPSLAFGGSCFKKDILCLIYICESYDLTEVANYWYGVLKINKYQKKRFLRTIISNMFDNIYDKSICVFGVTFKANTSDTRTSPALSIIKKLFTEGAKIIIYDPCAREDQLVHFFKRITPDNMSYEERFVISKDPYDAVQKANAIVVCTEWDEFKNLDYEKIYDFMEKPAHVFDGRLILDIEKLKKIGFHVFSIGSKSF